MKEENHDMSIYDHRNFGFWPQNLWNSLMNDSFFDGFGMGGFKVDVKEKTDEYIVEAEMPGMDKDHVQIDINERALTITANMDEVNEQKDNDGRYLRRERRTGSFRRSFALDNIRADDIKAEMKNGILTIRCPKKSPSGPSSKRISIQ